MIWKKIKNYNYHVCENGDIKNLKTNKLLKGTIKGGYNMIALYDKNGNKKNMRRHNKSIIQLNMENEFIKLYESLNQAGEYLSLKPSNISRALVKNKPHGGYIWNYINSDKYTKITTFENEIIYIHPKYSFLKFID